MAKPAVKIKGLKELQKEARRTKDAGLTKALKDANRAAAEPVLDLAKVLVPVRTGALAKSIKNASNARKAVVQAGSRGRVPYAGPIHYGWPLRKIKPQPFLYEAFDRRIDNVRKAYATNMQRLALRMHTK